MLSYKARFSQFFFFFTVRYARDPIKYYAEELYKSMIGLGTDDDKLIRIIVTRSDIDLFLIKMKYKELYIKTLTSSVEVNIIVINFRFLGG